MLSVWRICDMPHYLVKMDRPLWQDVPSMISLEEWQELAELPALEAAIADLLEGDDWQDTADIWDRRD